MGIINYLKFKILRWIINSDKYKKFKEISDKGRDIDRVIENPVIFDKHKVKYYGLKCIKKFNNLVKYINEVKIDELKRKNIEDYVMNKMICGDDVVNIYSEQLRIERELYKIIKNNVEMLYNVVGNGKILKILIDHLPTKRCITSGIKPEYGKKFQYKNKEFDIISNEEIKFIKNINKVMIILTNSWINIDLFDKCISHYRNNVGNYIDYVERKVEYIYKYNDLLSEFMNKSREILENMSNNML